MQKKNKVEATHVVEEDKFHKKPKGKPREYNELEHLSPIHAMKRGIAIMYNELGRLSEASQLTGLSPMESMSLNAYVKTISEVAKKHKQLQFGLTSEELDTVSDEKLLSMVRENLDTMDPKLFGPEAFHFMRSKNDKKTIEHDS